MIHDKDGKLMSMMTYNTARNKLHEEMMFLGLNWADLEHMLQESPNAFPVSVIEAYKVYKEALL
jgi:hypothetical protein